MNDSELSGEIKADSHPMHFGEPNQRNPLQTFHQRGSSGFQSKIAEFKAGLHSTNASCNLKGGTATSPEIPFWQQRPTNLLLAQNEDDDGGGDAENSFESALSHKIINERISDTENQRQIENQFHRDHPDTAAAAEYEFDDYPQDSLLSAVHQFPVPNTDFKNYFHIPAKPSQINHREDPNGSAQLQQQQPLASNVKFESSSSQVQQEYDEDDADSCGRKQVCDKCQKTPLNYIALSCGDNFCFECLASSQRVRSSMQESIVCSLCSKQTLLDSESQFAIERYLSESTSSTNPFQLPQQVYSGLANNSQQLNGNKNSSPSSHHENPFAYSSLKGAQLTEIDRRYSIPREEVIREEESTETILTNETHKHQLFQTKSADQQDSQERFMRSPPQMKTLEEEEQTSALSPFCRSHPEEEAAFFCWTCGVQCICRICLEEPFGKHRNHEISRVQGRCQDLQSRLEATFKDIQAKTTQMEEDELNISLSLRELSCTSEKVLVELKSILTRARNAIDFQEKTITEALAKRTTSINQKLENQMNKTTEAKKTVLTLARKLAVLQQPQCFTTTDSTESTIAFNYFAECTRILHQIFSKTNSTSRSESQNAHEEHESDPQQHYQVLVKNVQNYFKPQLDTLSRLTKHLTQPLSEPLPSFSQQPYNYVPPFSVQPSSSVAPPAALSKVSSQAIPSFLDPQRKAMSKPPVEQQIKSTSENSNQMNMKNELLKEIQDRIDQSKASQSAQNVTTFMTNPTCHSVLLDSSNQDAWLNGTTDLSNKGGDHLKEKSLSSFISPTAQSASTASMKGLASELITAFKRGKDASNTLNDTRKSTIQSLEFKDPFDGRSKEKTERSFDSPYALHQSIQSPTPQYQSMIKEGTFNSQKQAAPPHSSSLFISNMKKQNFSAQQFQKIVTQLPFQSAQKQQSDQQHPQHQFSSSKTQSSAATKEQSYQSSHNTGTATTIRSTLAAKVPVSSTSRALQLMKAQRQERQNRLSEDFKLSNFHVYTEPSAGSSSSSSSSYNNHHLSSHPLKISLGSPGLSGRKERSSANQVMNELTAFQEAIKSSSIFERELRKKEAEWEKKGMSGGRSPLKNSPGSSLSTVGSVWEKKKSFGKPETTLNSLASPSANSSNNLHALKALYKSQQQNNRATSNISLQKYTNSSSGSTSMLSFDSQQPQGAVSSFTNHKARSSTPTACPTSPPHSGTQSNYFTKGFIEAQSSKPLYFMPQKKSQIDPSNTESKRLTKPKSFTSRNLMTMFDKSPTNEFFLRDYHSNASSEDRYSVTPFI